MAEPTYEIGEHQKKKQSQLKFFLDGCYEILESLELKPERYSFSNSYHTEGLPEPWEAEAVFEDLLDGGGDLPRNIQMALIVAKALVGKGVPDAEIYLGSELQAFDPEKAEQYFIYAAIRDKCVAQAHLAYSYYTGAFTEQNFAKSYFWALQLNKERNFDESVDNWKPSNWCRFTRI